MNEFEFHKRLLENPYQLSDDMLVFLKAHPQHQKSVQKARDLDSKISNALDVKVPEGLIERILLNQSYQELPQNQEADNAHQTHNAEKAENAERKSAGLLNVFGLRNHLSQSWQFAASGMAASLLVAVMFFGLWQNPLPTEPLTGDALVAHILHHVEEDPSLMLPQKMAHSPQELSQLFAAVGATLEGQLEAMSYAGECDIEGQTGLHVVMQDEQGPVTVIIMPGPQIDAMQAFNKSGYMGELIPVKGGLVAIVGSSTQQLALIQSRFFKAVRFG